jgi:Ca-activated chloride channel family protein
MKITPYRLVSPGLVVVIASFALATHVCAQVPPDSTYRLDVAVDEVSVTIHAADAHGLPILDLKLDELKLLDNGRPAEKILSFEKLQDLPVRAGILVDTSVSMQEDRPGNLAIWTSYASRILQNPSDQAFIMDFDFLSKIAQPWTSDSALLTSGVRKVHTDAGSRIGGTAIFDAIYRACQNQFGKLELNASGNFILLFSDGEDNASHTYLKEAVDMCQRSNTAIYAFRTGGKTSFSSGPRTLAEITRESGGRLFYDDSDSGIANDLNTIENDVRTQYRIVYKPPELKHDGSFHHIQLKTPDRVDSVTIRSGYYAPHGVMLP